MRKMINEFRGEFHFLSNFYRLSNGITIEHLFQAEKTTSLIWKFKILTAMNPTEARRLGRKAPIKKNWKKKRILIMNKLVYCKFSFDSYLKEALLKTENAILIEGNYWHDNFWGDCYCKRCEDIPGKNNLGKIHMRVREKIK